MTHPEKVRATERERSSMPIDEPFSVIEKALQCWDAEIYAPPHHPRNLALAALAKLKEAHRNALAWKPTAIQAAGEIAAKTAMAEEVDRLHLEACAALTRENERVRGELADLRERWRILAEREFDKQEACVDLSREVAVLTKDRNEAREEVDRLRSRATVAEGNAKDFQFDADRLRRAEWSQRKRAGEAEARVAHLEGALRRIEGETIDHVAVRIARAALSSIHAPVEPPATEHAGRGAAYQQGVEIRRAGCGEDQCPYTKPSGSAEGWLKGFRAEPVVKQPLTTEIPEAPLTHGEDYEPDPTPEQRAAIEADYAEWQKQRGQRIGDGLRAEVLAVFGDLLDAARNSMGAAFWTCAERADKLLARLSASPEPPDGQSATTRTGKESLQVAPGTPGTAIDELERLGKWVRAMEYERDAPDEIARVIENRVRALRKGAEVAPEGSEGREGIPQPCSPNGKNGAPEEPSAVPSDAAMLDWLSNNEVIQQDCYEGGESVTDTEIVVLAAKRLLTPIFVQEELWERERNGEKCWVETSRILPRFEVCQGGQVIWWRDRDQNGLNWNPLTSDSDAFMLVDAMKAKGFSYTLIETARHSSFTGYVWFRRGARAPDGLRDEDREPGYCRITDSRPRAIVLAALKATSGKM